MITREESIALIKKNVKNKNLVNHMIAVGAIMKGLAEHFGEDQQLWEAVGLLHDVDYETFGEHQDAGTGIFDFMKAFPTQILENTDINFLTPSEVAKKYDPVSAIHVPNAISWADEERDLTAWLGNELQDEASGKLYELLPMIQKCTDKGIISDWQKLQNSDHFYYMCTKWFSDGDVHKYFNPYNSPYDAFINFMNVVSDFAERVKATCPVDKNDENLTEEELHARIKVYQANLRKLRTQNKKTTTKK